MSTHNLKNHVSIINPPAKNLINLKGRRFGNLKVLKIYSKDKYGHYFWLCKCDCGKLKPIKGNNLRTKSTKSCGCRYNKKIINGKKRCSLCKKLVSIIKFSSAKSVACKSSGLSSRCRKCESKYSKFNMWKNKYGITIETYNRLLLKQNNVCAICKKTNSMKVGVYKQIKSLAIDHCHTTGKIRGLLCQTCNVGIGNFADNINLLYNAIKYLKNNKI